MRVLMIFGARVLSRGNIWSGMRIFVAWENLGANSSHGADGLAAVGLEV
jgi:hypothetical protein